MIPLDSKIANKDAASGNGARAPLFHFERLACAVPEFVTERPP